MNEMRDCLVSHMGPDIPFIRVYEVPSLLTYLKTGPLNVLLLGFSGTQTAPRWPDDASTTGKSGGKADPRSAKGRGRGRACEVSQKRAPSWSGSDLHRPSMAFPRLLYPGSVGGKQEHRCPLLWRSLFVAGTVICPHPDPHCQHKPPAQRSV